MARVRNTFWRKQIDKLVQSENIPVVFKQYLNFGTTGGESGYGFRDNAGTIQYKNSGGSWANLGSGGGGGGGDMLASIYDPANIAEQVVGTTAEQTVSNKTLTDTNSIAFDLAAGVSVTQGQMAWNADEETIDIGLNGAVLQVGQETLYHVRNNTGSSIANGKPVMATGTIGASSRITAALMDGSTITNAKLFLGITTEDIANDSDGKVTHFGKVRGIQTNGANYGETWADGDIIYVDTSTAGALTNVAPSAGSLKMPIAIVIFAHATNGTLFVRASSLDENAYQAYSSILANTTASFTTADETKLDGIEAGAEVNNISDVNATDLTDGGDTTLHIHDGRYYTETEVDTLLSGKANTSHTHVISDVTGLQTSLDGKASTSHTHTVSQITDFDTEVSNNTDVAANTAARHTAVTVTDSAEIDFTLTGQNITASLIAGSIDETKLDISVNASLDLADSASQPGHTHIITDITGLQTALDGKAPALGADDNYVTDAEKAALHTHSNKALLDTYTQTEANLADAVTKKHTHTNQAILDATTASFTTADETKLDGIEAGAEVNTVDSVNSQTGAVVLDADDIDDTTTTNKFTTASDISKLAGIEAGADVTDTANVTAAGALMDSEVTNLAAVKAFNPTDYAPALGVDDNYVTDAQKTIIAATTASYTTAEATKLGYISVTQSVDLDQIESDTATNNAKVTNATHTGDVTGATALTIQPTAISGKTSKTTLAGTEEVLINDAGTLKKTTAQAIADLGGGGGGGGGISEELALYYAIAF